MDVAASPSDGVADGASVAVGAPGASASGSSSSSWVGEARGESGRVAVGAGVAVGPASMTGGVAVSGGRGVSVSAGTGVAVGAGEATGAVALGWGVCPGRVGSRVALGTTVIRGPAD